MENLVKTQEKMQICWGINLFTKFVMYANKRGLISTQQSKQLQEQLASLVENQSENIDSEKVAEKLNQCIEVVNKQMKENIDPAKYAPFPQFSFVISGHERSAVLDHIDMVERTLTEAAEAKVLDWEAESECFAEVLKIFAQLEKNQIRPIEALAQLLVQFENINKLLKEEDKLPLLDLNAYE